MSLFKRKKKEEEQDIKKEKKREEKLAKIKEAKKKERAAEKEPEVIKPQPVKAKKDEIKTAPGILSKPQITEKATLLQESNQYIFRVFPHSTKPEVRKSVEEVYGVNVEKIRIVNVQRKRKRLGNTRGWKQGYKKAIVSLRKGQAIEIMPR